MIYTYDVPLDVFQVLRKDNQGNTVQTALGYSLITNRTGEGGIHFPPELQLPLKAGDEVIYNVVVPPGVTKAGFYSQFNNKTVQFRVDDGPKESYEPAIYPVGYRIGVDSSDTPVNLLPRKHQVRIIWDKQEPELLMGLSFTWQIKLENSSIYDSWVLSGKPMQVQQETPVDTKALALKELETLAIQSELIKPLMDFGACTDMQEFLIKLDRTHTIDALLRFVELAKK